MRSRALVLAAALLTCAHAVADAETVHVRTSTGPHASPRIDGVVRTVLQAHGYDVAPTPRATLVVTPAITRLAVTRSRVDCAIELRVATLDAQGRERWDAGRTVIARGHATVTPGGERGANECVQAATLDSMQQRVLPFLDQRVAAR